MRRFDGCASWSVFLKLNDFFAMGQLVAFPKTMLLSAKENHYVLVDTVLSQPTFSSDIMTFFFWIELGTAQCLLRGLNLEPFVIAVDHLDKPGDKNTNHKILQSKLLYDHSQKDSNWFPIPIIA